MRSYNRFAAQKEKARKRRIVRLHCGGWRPNKPWKTYRYLLMTEPGWWVREFMTRPARIRANQLCHLVEMGRDPENILWPDSRKPHYYYW